MFGKIQNYCVFVAGILTAGSAVAQVHSGASNKCDTPGHRQFDFWIGKWDVYRDYSDQLVAHSVIEKLYGGCAVRENWMPIKGSSGGSLNSFRPESGEWRQVWTDADNELHEYVGRWTGQMLEMEGSAANARGAVTRLRMTFEPLRDKSVVQTGYTWSPESKSWAQQYRFVYRRAHER